MKFNFACAVAGITFCAPAFLSAGGSGENMLLIVNPNDESALRMANAYAAARAIPDRNIIYIAPPTAAGYQLNTISYTAFDNTYRNAIPAAIAARGLTGQIDYIGTFGQPHVVNGSAPTSATPGAPRASIKYGFNYVVSMIPKLNAGLFYPDLEYRKSELFQTTIPYVNRQFPPTNMPVLPYTEGSNYAIHQSDKQWYMSGNIGYSGTYAITTQQYIDSYARTAAADGTKPAGTYYFMENDGVRSDTREPYWTAVQNYMTAHGIPWEEIRQLYDGSPKDKTDVRGAVVGAANYATPNGSTYLPGSWADSLTSSGGSYGGPSQTKADKFIRSGAGATSGSVTEPFAIADRFPAATLFIYSNDGSTLGEAFFKSTARPDDMMFQGDLLSQAYADVPSVSLTSAPVPNTPVTGTVSIEATASLNNPDIATGIAKLILYVDGVEKQVITDGSGTFNLDTTGLSDGRHEIRVVAVNNAQAESRGYTRSFINVINNGQSVAATGTVFNAQHNEMVSVPVAAIAGTGSPVNRIELRSLGRVVGTVSGAAGLASLNAQILAFGNNVITPVAVLANGSEVAGAPIVVNRDFHKLAGAAVTPASDLTPGFKFEYFTGKAGNTIAGSDFSGTPDQTFQGMELAIDPSATTPNVPSAYLNGNNAGMAVRVTSRFNISEGGEYSFFFDSSSANFEGLQFSIDGELLLAHEFYNPTNGTFLASKHIPTAQTLRSMYLMPGEHSLELLLANPVGELDTALASVWSWRGPDGNTIEMSSTAFYTVVPEPGTIFACSLVGAWALMRRKRTISR